MIDDPKELKEETEHLRRVLAKVLLQFSVGSNTGNWYVKSGGGNHCSVNEDMKYVLIDAAREVICPNCGRIAQPGVFYRGRMFCNDEHFEEWDAAIMAKKR